MLFSPEELYAEGRTEPSKDLKEEDENAQKYEDPFTQEPHNEGFLDEPVLFAQGRTLDDENDVLPPKRGPRRKKQLERYVPDPTSDFRSGRPDNQRQHSYFAETNKPPRTERIQDFISPRKPNKPRKKASSRKDYRIEYPKKDHRQEFREKDNRREYPKKDHRHEYPKRPSSTKKPVYSPPTFIDHERFEDFPKMDFLKIKEPKAERTKPTPRPTTSSPPITFRVTPQTTRRPNTTTPKAAQEGSFGFHALKNEFNDFLKF